jgi:hypothetical protein
MPDAIQVVLGFYRIALLPPGLSQSGNWEWFAYDSRKDGIKPLNQDAGVAMSQAAADRAARELVERCKERDEVTLEWWNEDVDRQNL